MNQPTNNPELAALVKEFRANRALTQEHLAQLAEVNIRTIQRLESTGSCSKENLRAIAEAFDLDVAQLIETAERRKKSGVGSSKDIEELTSANIIVGLQEVNGPKDLIDGLAGCDGQISDVPDVLTEGQAELIGFVLDYLKDYADIQSDVYPSERMQMMQEVKSKLDHLKQSGISAFIGQFSQQVVMPNQPDKPFEQTISVIRLLPSGAKQILTAADGTSFSVGIIPKRNLRPS